MFTLIAELYGYTEYIKYIFILSFCGLLIFYRPKYHTKKIVHTEVRSNDVPYKYKKIDEYFKSQDI